MPSGIVPATGTFRAGCAPILSSAGFVRVAEGLSTPKATPHPAFAMSTRTSNTLEFGASINYFAEILAPRSYDVWRSPAAANGDGADWFLVVTESVGINDNTGVPDIGFSVAEGFDVETGKVIKGSPAQNPGSGAATTAPAADFSFPTPLGLNQLTYVGWSTPRSEHLFDATARRVILYPTTTQSGAYAMLFAGLGERFLPPSREPRTPLMTYHLNQTAAHQGGITREAGVTGASSSNWRTTVATQVWAFGGQSDAHLGGFWSQPHPIRSTRNNGGVRMALPQEFRLMAAGSAQGDTLAETQFDGTVVNYTALGSSGTYVRVP